jgi:two-component sensor histidine kinase/CHASE3 domain sensor protein
MFQMPTSSRYLVRSTSAFLLIGFVALMAIVVTTFWLGERAQTYFEDANTTRDTRVAAVELRNALQTAESSERGFIISGSEIYLAPYQTAKFQAQRNLSALQTLLLSFPGSDPTLERLTSIVASKFEDFDRSIELKREQHDDEALKIFRTNEGKALTDEANVFFSGIIARADSRLTAGVAEQRANAGLLRLVSGIGALVIIAVIGGATYGVARYTRELRSTRDQLNVLNGELEQRVATRTADLAQSRDRAEVLLSEVNHRVANSLALVASLVSLQSRVLHDQVAKDALAETQERVFAISLVHKRLYDSNNAGSVALDEYLSGLLDHLRTSLRSQGHGVTISYDIEPIELSTDASINLGIVINELVTNSFKYAYPDGVGSILVRLTKQAEDVELIVEDNGVGRAEGAPAKGTGVGTRIVNSMCMNLGGQIEYRAGHPGTSARLRFPFRPARSVALQEVNRSSHGAGTGAISRAE